MSREVTNDLSAAGRVPHMDGVLQIQVGSHRGKIVGVMVHVMTYTDLGRTTVPTAVVGDDTIPVLQENSIWASQSSLERRQPSLKTIGWPDPQSL